MGSRRHVKTFTQRSSNGRRREEDDLLLGICDRIPDFIDVALLIQSTDRAGHDALAAADAGRCVKTLVKRRADTYVESSSDLADGADPLYIVAGGDAAQALDTLVVVANDIRRGVIDLILRLVVLEVIFIDAVVIGQFLKFAVISSHAGETLLVVRRKDQLDGGLSGCTDSSCVGENLQAFLYRVSTCCGKSASSLDLNYTDAAGADTVDVFEIAERGDLNIDRFGCLKDSGALRYSDRNIVNL